MSGNGSHRRRKDDSQKQPQQPIVNMSKMQVVDPSKPKPKRASKVQTRVSNSTQQAEETAEVKEWHRKQQAEAARRRDRKAEADRVGNDRIASGAGASVDYTTYQSWATQPQPPQQQSYGGGIDPTGYGVPNPNAGYQGGYSSVNNQGAYQGGGYPQQGGNQGGGYLQQGDNQYGGLQQGGNQYEVYPQQGGNQGGGYPSEGGGPAGDNRGSYRQGDQPWRGNPGVYSQAPSPYGDSQYGGSQSR